MFITLGLATENLIAKRTRNEIMNIRTWSMCLSSSMSAN